MQSFCTVMDLPPGIRKVHWIAALVLTGAFALGRKESLAINSHHILFLSQVLIWTAGAGAVLLLPEFVNV